MNHFTSALGVTVFAALIVTLVSSVNAQNMIVQKNAERLYGQGVHAYHAGHYEMAVDLFNQAAEMGSQDPRLFFFRGLTHSALGDSDQAQADFDTGANFEMTSTMRYYPVNRSLQRIQGPIRLQIEESRSHAVAIAIESRQNGENGNVNVTTQAMPEPRVYRSTNVLDGSPRVQPPAPQVNFPDVGDVNEPTSLIGGSGETVEIPPEAQLGVVEQPVVADTVPSTTDAAGNQQTTQAAANPFSGDSGSGNAGNENPFGGSEPAKKQGGDPFGGGDDKGGSNDDPFGGGDDKSDDDKSDDDKSDDDKSDDDSDPFGGGGDSGGDDDNDPFGDGN